MKLLSLVAVGFLSLATSTLTHAAVQTETVSYKVGDQEYKGFVAWDDATADKRPGVLVCPEWWGLNDYPKTRAKQLAELGYVAFVADFYGDGKTTEDPKVAGEWAGKAKGDVTGFRALATAGLDQLKARPQVDASKLGAIGYCFGGSAVLELAREGADVKGVVSFHGALATKSPAESGKVKAKVLALHGDADPMVKPEEVAAFEKEMKDAGADYTLVKYPGAEHAFTNPAADSHNIPGIKYNTDADKKSWEAMKEFFATLFK